MYPKVSRKNKPENRDAWGLRPLQFNGVTSLKRKNRLYLLQKVFKKAFFTRRKLGWPASSFFPTNRLRSRRQFAFTPKFTERHISKKSFYTRASHAPEKARNTWLFTCNYTFYIWKRILFDFWVSGPTLNLGKLRKKVVSLQNLSCSLNILGGQLRQE